jgi:hypothetical protein
VNPLKPHIFLNRGVWECVGEGVRGLSGSPKEAWMQWYLRLFVVVMR